MCRPIPSTMCGPKFLGRVLTLRVYYELLNQTKLLTSMQLWGFVNPLYSVYIYIYLIPEYLMIILVANPETLTTPMSVVHKAGYLVNCDMYHSKLFMQCFSTYT